MTLRLPAPSHHGWVSHPHHSERTLRIFSGILAGILAVTSIVLVGLVNHLHAEGAQAGMRFWVSEGLLAFAAAIAVGFTALSGSGR